MTGSRYMLLYDFCGQIPLRRFLWDLLPCDFRVRSDEERYGNHFNTDDEVKYITWGSRTQTL